MDIGFYALYAASGLVLFLFLLSTLFGLPGNLLVLLSAIAIGYYEGFLRIDWVFIAYLTGAWLLGEAGEFFASAIGAKKAKASRRAIVVSYIGAFVGMLAGTAVLPIIGTLAGSLCGAFLAGYWAELHQTGNGLQARKVAVHVVLGQLFGLVFKLAIGLAMAVAILARLPIQA